MAGSSFFGGALPRLGGSFPAMDLAEAMIAGPKKVLGRAKLPRQAPVAPKEK